MITFQKADGANYAPKGKTNLVVKPGEFRFAAIGLDHGHIFGMCNGLIEAGAELVWVYDPDPGQVEKFCKMYPGVKVARAEAEILDDQSIKLVASAAIPVDRCALALCVMDAGKDFFADKPPLTTLEQLATARAKTKSTGRKFTAYYAEHLHVEAVVYTGDLIQQGAIGRVIQVLNIAPHRISLSARPAGFFEKEKYGGILCDIGSHQIEQFLFYTGAKDARVLHSKVGNYHHPEYSGFEDFGDATLVADNGATHYFRVDWFTPDGLGSWGDGRAFILGTDGYIELRKYLDVARDTEPDHVYLVDHRGEHHIPVHGKIGYPFFGQLILDCLHRTENAMTQAYVFKVMELAIQAEMQAVRVA